MAPEAENALKGSEAEMESLVPIYRVTVMSWCFQFLLDLLWIPLAAYFKDLGLGLGTLGLVFAANLGVRIVPNVLATRLGVETDVACMLAGLAGFGVNLAWPEEPWAILVMSAAGGLIFVRAHLSVHGKLAAGASVESLTRAARWSGAARNLGTMVAFVVPVAVYQTFGWRAVITMAMGIMCLYLVMAALQHRNYRAKSADEADLAPGEGAEEPGLVEEAPREAIPWIDWVIAGSFCVTELQMNIQAAAVPTTLLELGVPMPLVGGVQAVGQLIAMGFLVLLSQGFCPCLQKRPLNLLLSFSGTFVGMAVLWAARASEGDDALYIIVPGLYFFYACAYTAQVTMLECLTGVLDMSDSIFVMGISEIVGCACSLVGGYLGPALLERSPAAPFALETVVAFATTLVLGVGLGLRACDQHVVCQTTSEYYAVMEDQARAAGVSRRALRGLRHMHRRPDSYIGVEQKLRKASTDTGLSAVDSVSTMASSGDVSGGFAASSAGTGLPDLEESPAAASDASSSETPRRGRSPSEAAADSASLAAPLLAHPSPTAGPWEQEEEATPPSKHWRRHQRMRSEPLAAPKVAMSTHQARQYKRALVSFGQTPIALDRTDYVVERDLERSVVLSHARSKSYGM